MTVKGRPEKKVCEFCNGTGETSDIFGELIKCPRCHLVYQWNQALDADTEYFVSVLEGLRYKGENDINDVHTECACKFNARIEGAIKSVKGE